MEAHAGGSRAEELTAAAERVRAAAARLGAGQ